MVRSDRGTASAEVTEDNEDTDVKSGFERVLGMASVFGVFSAGQRLTLIPHHTTPIPTLRPRFFGERRNKLCAGVGGSMGPQVLGLPRPLCRHSADGEAASVPYRTIHLVNKKRFNL